jgi:ATP-dependent RNA helicase DDX24/MAK5
MNAQKGATSKDRTSTSKISLPAGLTIQHIHLLQAEKDAYTYHFLLARPRGRTLIFVNAIATAKRVAATLTLLGVKAKAIHAEMQQRQRLKALDRFREDGSDNDEDPVGSKNEEDLLSVDNGIIKQKRKQSLGAASERTVLVATDVAARGLDISRVAHVVHYDLPRTADTFVHRSGRTARADATGMALILVSESDALAYEAILKSIFGAVEAETAISSKSSVTLRPNFEERANLDGQDSNIEKLQTSIVPRPFEVDLGLLRVAVDRTIVASKLVKFEETQNRAASESSWFKKHAAAMDVIIDDFDDFDDSDTPAGRQSKRVSSEDGVRRSAENLQAARLRKQLSELLARPIRGRGSAGEKPQRKKVNGTTKQNPQNMLKRKRGRSLKKKKK